MSLLQLVDLSNSHLSGAIVNFPKDEFDFDPDWEIDPKDVIILDKLGEHPQIQSLNQLA